ncbi:MAG: DUF222 domain-containing protein [Actinomycetota bacterium]
MTASPALASRDSSSPFGESHPQFPLRYLTADHIATLGLDGVRRALEQVAAAQRNLDAVRVLLNGRLRQLSAASPAVMPEQVIVKATSVSRPDARRDMQRVDTLEKFPHMREAVLSGDISTHHVDVIARAVRHLDGNALQLFADEESRLVGIARRTSPDNFSRVVQQTALRAEHDSGVDTTERQRRRTWLRHWVDNDSGMVRLHGELDPESGLRLVGRLQRAVQTLFNAGEGHDASGSPSDKPAHLNALALVALVCDSADSNVVSINGGGSRTDVSVVVDIDTLRRGLHAKSVISTGTDIALPVETVRRLACEARIIPVVMSSTGVVLDMGRATRISTASQRKALETMHPTCAVPRCGVPVARCEPHHINYWINGGPTNLDNLVPLCNEHHRCVHEGGWRLTLDAGTRRVTVAVPGQ